MSKNILILLSSPRCSGNSDMLCRGYMRESIEGSSQVEKIFLCERKPHPRTECGVCSRYMKPCPQEDGAAEIVDCLAANFIGFLDCLGNAEIKGVLFCGGVWHVREIRENTELQKVYEKGKLA